MHDPNPTTDTNDTNIMDLETSMKNRYGVCNGHKNLQPWKNHYKEWSDALLFGFQMTH